MLFRVTPYFLSFLLLGLPLWSAAQTGAPEKNVYATSFEKAYAGKDPALARRLLLRMHRKAPEQVFRYQEEAETLLGVGQRGPNTLEPLESDLMADIYRYSARFYPENASDFQIQLCYFLMAYPERYDSLLLVELDQLEQYAPHDMPLFLLKELTERSLEQPTDSDQELEIRWRRWVRIREHLEERAIIHREENQEVREILRDLEIRHNRQMPPCDSLNALYLRMYGKDQLQPDSYVAFMEMAWQQGCTEGYVVEDAPQEAARSGGAAGLRRLGRQAKAREDYPEALDYWLRSLSSRKDPRLKAADLLEIADVEARLMNFNSALTHLEEAAELHPTWGMPYLHMADLYVLGGATCEWSEFDAKALYWVAIDYCLKARRIDESLAEEVGRRIFEYRQECPTRDEVFFRGFQEGDTYPIRCWIRTTTTVKLF